LAFHRNNGPILYHFRDKARYWSKIAIFHISPAFDAAISGHPCRNIATRFGIEKLEWCGYPVVKKFEDMITRFDTTQEHGRQQDGRTERQKPHDDMSIVTTLKVKVWTIAIAPIT